MKTNNKSNNQSTNTSMENSQVVTIECPKCGNPINIEFKTGKSKAEQRIDALKEKGIDTSAFFAANAANGQEFLFRMIDGVPTFVKESEDNDIVSAIINGGTIPERRLFRQHIMAMVFRMLDDSNGRSGNFTDYMKGLGYNYIWKMMRDEFESQANMLRNGDKESLSERQMFFNKTVVAVCMYDYIEQIKQVWNGEVSHTNRREHKEYRFVFGTPLYRSELNAIAERLANIKQSVYKMESPQQIVAAINEFTRGWIAPRGNVMLKQPKVWQDAYKGAGAYFTLKNMIMFHHCALFFDEYTQMVFYESKQALDELRKYAESNDGYKVLGLLKHNIKENGINIGRMRSEWREAKMKKFGKKN